MFPHRCGAELASAVAAGTDPALVVPDDYMVIHGGTQPLPLPGTVLSATVGPTIEAAAAALPHGQIRVALTGAIRANGGTVTWAPETSRHHTVNRQHVNVVEHGKSCFSGLQRNPIPRKSRIDGDRV